MCPPTDQVPSTYVRRASRAPEMHILIASTSVQQQRDSSTPYLDALISAYLQRDSSTPYLDASTSHIWRAPPHLHITTPAARLQTSVLPASRSRHLQRESMIPRCFHIHMPAALPQPSICSAPPLLHCCATPDFRTSILACLHTPAARFHHSIRRYRHDRTPAVCVQRSIPRYLHIRTPVARVQSSIHRWYHICTTAGGL